VAYSGILFGCVGGWGVQQIQLRTTIRIKDETKYLYAKKQTLNHQIYHLHITLANTCGDDWHHIQTTIEEELGKETKEKYKTLDNKLNLLAKNQTTTPQTPLTFHPRLVNNTNISFSKGETMLL
jgi:formylmethanofuran dehydrogenase subunit A